MAVVDSTTYTLSGVTIIHQLVDNVSHRLVVDGVAGTLYSVAVPAVNGNYIGYCFNGTLVGVVPKAVAAAFPGTALEAALAAATGATKVGIDSSGWSNILPANDDLKGALDAIDTALGAGGGGDTAYRMAFTVTADAEAGRVNITGQLKDLDGNNYNPGAGVDVEIDGFYVAIETLYQNPTEFSVDLVSTGALVFSTATGKAVITTDNSGALTAKLGFGSGNGGVAVQIIAVPIGVAAVRTRATGTTGSGA